MKNMEEELKKQGEKIEEIGKNIRLIKRVYITSIILKIIIIAIPVIGLIISMPKIMEIYQEVITNVTV